MKSEMRDGVRLAGCLMATLPLRAILQYSSQRVAASRDGKLVVVSGTVRLKATHFPNGGGRILSARRCASSTSLATTATPPLITLPTPLGRGVNLKENLLLFRDLHFGNAEFPSREFHKIAEMQNSHDGYFINRGDPDFL